MELYQKIYVKPAFLESEHGKIPCTKCHGGDAGNPDWQTAHDDVVRDPTFPDPSATCGECHEELAAAAPSGLHYSLRPMRAALERRSSGAHADRRDMAFERHCATCHASCGQCHVSRPDYVNGGFLAGHLFQERPPMDTTCASCHGGRVHGEYTGADDAYEADTHYIDQEMTCMHCHPSAEMHAAATEVETRFDLPELPGCPSCHESVRTENNGNRFHTVHGGRLACQVCHAQAGKSCFGCHVGTDDAGLPYFKCRESRMMLKIGRNPRPSEKHPAEYVMVRHAPVNPQLLDRYGKNLLDRFDVLPTWKMSAPHSIQRITERNRACNKCHGHAELFLTDADLEPWERSANAQVVVPEDRIPVPVDHTEALPKGGQP